jgi:hypothetical protein
MSITFEKYSFHEFNDLTSVESADADRLRNSTFDAFLDDFALLAIGWGVGDLVGACLLHRHFLAVEGSAPIESAATRDRQPALVTRIRRLGRQSFPTRWRVRQYADGNTELIPLEFSDDPELGQDFSAIPIGFVGAFAELLATHGLQPIIGLALTRRKSLPPQDGFRYLELTEEDESVITLYPEAEVSTIDPIVTVWAPDVVRSTSCVIRTICRSTDPESADGGHHLVEGHDS